MRARRPDATSTIDVDAPAIELLELESDAIPIRAALRRVGEPVK